MGSLELVLVLFSYPTISSNFHHINMLLESVLVCVCLSSYVSAYPDHADCNVTFTIPAACNEVKNGLANQMNLWDRSTSCPGDCHKVRRNRGPPLVQVNYEGTNTECAKCPCGQKCLYQLTSVTDNLLKGSHFTPVNQYEDAITFRFNEISDSSCVVTGFSKIRQERHPRLRPSSKTCRSTSPPWTRWRRSTT